LAGRELRIFAHEEVLTSCDVCGAIELHTVDARAHVMECASCGYRFVNPRPTQADIAAAYSDPHAYDHWLREEEGRKVMWQKRLDLLEREAGARRGRLLDVGAGIGTFLALARERGWEVTGTEVSESAIRLARKRHSLELIPGQLQEARLPAGSFEVVTLWHVLEHVPSPSSVLRTAHSVLRPGGMVAVAVPNDARAMVLPRRLKRLLTRTAYERYEPVVPGEEVHLSHFRPDVLRRLLQRTGFEPASVTVDDQYPKPTSWTSARVGLTRALARTTGLNLGNSLLVTAHRA
jgi:2-polyprenyl-3-methyl-5-hydroxy-6-metoxy-1,4-benzoquinol methylase